MKIAVTATSLKPGESGVLNRLEAFADEIVYNPYGRPLSEDELIPFLQGCEGYIAGLDYITKKVINSVDKLKVISRYGAGVDRIDLEAARTRGIIVCNTPGVNAQAVADLAMGLMLSLARKIHMLDKKTREGQWIRSTGIELFGKTIGIIGLGAVGKGVARRAQGFSMKVLAYDPFINRQYAEENNITISEFGALIREADIICLHLPLTPETRRLISAEVMQSMKKGAIIINTARGGLIEEEAAYRLLKSGRLGGLGLDVYEEEPPKKSPLFDLDNVILTPHIASHTHEAAAAMASMSVDNLITVLSGKSCPYTV
ncbi:MAG: phosphoglycerate dehydrogenase [Treponema sp.]|nr:phosphoglycerate dehydrogenase [Treponema sp.]